MNTLINKVLSYNLALYTDTWKSKEIVRTKSSLLLYEYSWASFKQLICSNKLHLFDAQTQQLTVYLIIILVMKPCAKNHWPSKSWFSGVSDAKRESCYWGRIPKHSMGGEGERRALPKQKQCVAHSITCYDSWFTHFPRTSNVVLQ